jgi:adenosylmethionine-8-amino-7-oxononanoate aminotransferase
MVDPTHDIPLKQWQAWDKTYLWHPFTQHQLWNAGDPMVIVAGDAEFVIDSEGNRYIDGHSSLWCNLHGHRHPSIDAALKSQIDRISHSTLLGLTNPWVIELAKRLVDLSPAGLDKVFFSDDGSTAIEVACKMAYGHFAHRGEPDRKEFIALRNSYHGDTIGAVSLGGIDAFHDLYKPLLFKTHFAPSPYAYRCEQCRGETQCNLRCADGIEQILSERKDRVAAVVLEPLMQCAGGMIAAPPGHVQRVREICDQHGVLLIADEIAVGFGRTGKMFACEHENVTPDILCLSKGLTAGYMPLAATLVRNDIYESFLGDIDQGRTLYHGHTFTGNPLGCAAALASLNVFEKEQTLANLPEKIACIETHLKKLSALSWVGDVRQWGMIAGIELVKNKTTREAFPYAQQVGAKVCQAALQHGVIIRPLADVIVVFPPLSIRMENLQRLMEVIAQCIEQVMPTIDEPAVSTRQVDGLE